MRLAELVEVPERAAHRIHRIGGIVAFDALLVGVAGEQQPEPFLGQGEEDVVLAGEVAVDRRGAVFDPVGDLADRDVLIALGDEQVARRIQNCPRHRLALPFLPFLDAQWRPLGETVMLNSVHQYNTVRRTNDVLVPIAARFCWRRGPLSAGRGPQSVADRTSRWRHAFSEASAAAATDRARDRRTADREPRTGGGRAAQTQV